MYIKNKPQLYRKPLNPISLTRSFLPRYAPYGILDPAKVGWRATLILFVPWNCVLLKHVANKIAVVLIRNDHFLGWG